MYIIYVRLNFRRPKRTTSNTPSEDVAGNLKSSSELNLNAVTTSVPIRTTRTSRLRAAAATHSDTSPSPRKSNRSSSVQSLLEDVKIKSPKKSKLLDRDKTRPSRRQSNEKENYKSVTATRFDKDIGAIKTKSKHSNKKTILEKDKTNFIMTSPNGKNIDEKSVLKIDEKKNTNSIKEENLTNGKRIEVNNDKPSRMNSEEFFNDIANEKDISNNLDKEKIEDLFNNLVVDDVENQNGLEILINNEVMADNGLKYSHNSYVPAAKKAIDIKVDKVKVEDSVVPKVKEDVGGLLGAVCVRKVERFSELLSNLCSPCEADILFEDILVENGFDGDNNLVS